MTTSAQIEEVRSYYGKRESRWGYRVLLGGNRHFGYYEPGQHISMKAAQRQMELFLGRHLDLPAESDVLDAGCGEGHVAITLAQHFGFRVQGIDLLPDSIHRAVNNTHNAGLDEQVTFHVGDYSHIDAPDGSFDGVYTMETLVHAPDYKAALAEFFRILKPGGHLVLIEYSIPNLDQMPDGTEKKRQFYLINRRAAMHSLPYFVHGSFPQILADAGFIGMKSINIVDNIVPMLRRFYQLAIVPFTVLRWLHREDRFVNGRSSVYGYKYRSDFGYNIVTAVKPG